MAEKCFLLDRAESVLQWAQTLTAMYIAKLPFSTAILLDPHDEILRAPQVIDEIRRLQDAYCAQRYAQLMAQDALQQIQPLATAYLYGLRATRRQLSSDMSCLRAQVEHLTGELVREQNEENMKLLRILTVASVAQQRALQENYNQEQAFTLAINGERLRLVNMLQVHADEIQNLQARTLATITQEHSLLRERLKQKISHSPTHP